MVPPQCTKAYYEDLVMDRALALTSVMQSEFCDKTNVSLIFCDVFAEYTFDGGFVDFETTNPIWDDKGNLDPNIQHYTFYNKQYRLGRFCLKPIDFRTSVDWQELLFNKYVLLVIRASLDNYVKVNPKFFDDFILNRIKRAHEEAPLPTLRLRLDTFVETETSNNFKGTHETHILPGQPMYIPVSKKMEHLPFWRLTEKDFKLDPVKLRGHIKEHIIGV